MRVTLNSLMTNKPVALGFGIELKSTKKGCCRKVIFTVLFIEILSHSCMVNNIGTEWSFNPLIGRVVCFWELEVKSVIYFYVAGTMCPIQGEGGLY